MAQGCYDRRCAPPPPETCASDCEKRAREMGERCLEQLESDPATCEALVQGALDECLNTCGPAPEATCAEQCEEVAQERRAEVLGSGLGEARAARRARRAFRRCVQSCEQED